MAETQPAPRKRRWLIWAIRLPVWLMIIALLAASVVLVWLHQPGGRQWLKDEINRRVPGEFDFTSIGLQWPGALGLKGASYAVDSSTGAFRLQAGSIQAPDLLLGRPHIYARDIESFAEGRRIVSASRSVVSWPEGNFDGPIHVTLHQADFDPSPFLEADHDEPASATPARPPTVRLEFVDSRVRLPGSQQAYKWNGTLNLDGGAERLDGVIALSGGDGELSLSFDSGLALDGFRFAQAESHDLPVSVIQGATVGARVSGRARLASESGSMPAASASISLASFSLNPGAPVSASVDNAFATLEASLTEALMPRSVTAIVEHAPLSTSLSGAGAFNLPAGTATLIAEGPLSPTLPQRLDWQWPELGRMSARWQHWPPSATGEYQASVAIERKPVETLTRYAPEIAHSIMEQFSGVVSLNGPLTVRDGALQALDLNARIVNGAYSVAGIQIDRATLSGKVRGDARRIEASLRGDARATYSLDATRTISVRLEDASLELAYGFESKTFTLTLPTLSAAPMQDFTFRFHSQDGWNLSFITDAEQALPALQPFLTGEGGRSVEGMGRIDVSANGADGQIALRASSETFAAFSFDQEPALGAQLRNVSVSADWLPQDDGYSFETAITGDAPYFSYAGGDIEWPSQSLRVEWVQPRMGESEWTALLELPQLATASVKRTKDGGTVRYENVDLSGFLSPVFHQVILQKEEEAEPWFAGDGRISGSLTVDEWTVPPEVSGNVSAFIDDVRVDVTPSLRIHNATANLPLAFPLEFERLPAQSILFEAARVDVGEASFEAISSNLPISASEIELFEPFRLPLYGGTAHVGEARLLDWQSPAPLFSGAIRFEGLSLPQVAEVVPVAPSDGTLDGELSALRLSSEILAATGWFEAHAFDGLMTMSDFTINLPLHGQPIWTMDIDFEKLDLERITSHFDYGRMTGRVKGSIRNFELILPSNQGEWPYPRRFDITVNDDMGGLGQITRDTLLKIIDLGESPGLTRLVADRDVYLYSRLGLRSTLNGNDLKLYGTLRNNMFLTTDEVTATARRLFNPAEWFAIPVNIQLAQPDQVIPFDQVWRRLMSQINQAPSAP